MAVELSKGANTGISAPGVVVGVAASAALDIAALLVTGTGKVRTDADFVFFNQPTGPGVRLRPPAELDVTFAQLPPEIERIVVTATVDGAGTFATVNGLRATVRDQSGAELAGFTPTGLGTETALVVVELYRRQGAWKVRAVGQGYANGLGGIATDFGITVDDTPPAPPAPPTPPAPAPPPAAPAAPAPSYQPPPAAPGYPPAPPAAPPGYPPPPAAPAGYPP
ncbi:MAG: TerD family protein, partial [Micromonosporaceae bacterium]